MSIGAAPKHQLPLNLEELTEANNERQKTWTGADKIGLEFIGLEIGEEAGEVQGALKKLIRHREGIRGNKGQTEDELMAHLADEIGDTVINLSRLCDALNLNMSACVRNKFNRTSENFDIGVYL